MNKVLNEDRFFSMTWDYLHVYLPTQHRDSPKTAKSYEDGLTIFRRYLTDALSVSMADFRFEDLTYDFLLDYRIHLAETGCKPRTVNHRLAVIMAYMRYAASRKTALTQIYLNIADVPYMTVPSKIREIIEDKAALECFLAAPKPSKKGIRDQIILVVLYHIPRSFSPIWISSIPGISRISSRWSTASAVSTKRYTLALPST